MTSSAQISYPATEEDIEDKEAKEASASEEDTEEGIEEEVEEDDVPEDEQLDDAEELSDYVHRESGQPFDVSPEEFCADPYAQQGDRMSRMELGKKGEEAAVKYLRSRGYEILKRNWFCKFGEADIIARDTDGSLCFVEVKTRRSIEAGLPEEAITHEKRRRYERIALAYMMVSDDWEENDSVRFDAIGICVTGPHRAMLRHHKDCFNGSF